MSRAFLFPGQGSQAVGMGAELAEAFAVAREVFQEVDDGLSQPLSRLMFGGSESDLALTENAQPALLAVSLAVVRVIEKEAGKRLSETADFVAGHSLGEYAALAAAGSISLAETARLVKRRGQAMQEAVPVGRGAMAAVLGLDLEAVKSVAEAASAGEVCTPANDNAPGQIVVSGHKTAVQRAIAIAAERGAKRSILLPVSAPFHCALMAPAADVMAESLAQISILPPRLPLVANVTAAQVTEPERIRGLLVDQVTGLVRWRESVVYMRDRGVSIFFELGAGKILTGLGRRIDPDLDGLAVGTPAQIDTLVERL